MKVLKRILLGLLAIIVLLVIVSFFLPSKVHVERSRVIKAPQPLVYEQVNTLKNWEAWSPWHRKDPNMKLEYSGPPSGAGAMYKWDGNDEVGNGSLTITNSVPNSEVYSDMNFMEQYLAKGVYKFESTPEGTKVVWGFDTDMGMNPIGKYIGLFMDGSLGKDFEEGLKNLDSVSVSKAASAGTVMTE